MKRFVFVMAMCVITLVAQSAMADVLYDFDGSNQGWGSYGAQTTDSGLTAEGSVGDGRYHAIDFDVASWGVVDVSPTGLDLSGYTGITVDALLKDIPGYTPFTGTANLDIGITDGVNEAYAEDFPLTTTFQTFEATFADFVPVTVDMSNVQITLRILDDGNSGIAQFLYDQVTAVPEPGTLCLLAAGLFVVVRRNK